MVAQEADALKALLAGETFARGADGYDAARVIWNGTVEKQPEVIVRCRGLADVIIAVNFARERGLGVSVRAGGHHVAGTSLLDGGLVIDLREMRSVRVDPNSATLRCEGGAQIGDLDREAQVFGLAVPMGVVSETGVAGLTLAGGMGWMRLKHGMSCDNLISADVVTADGQLRHASREENSDLFWALRGGGWDLGVVTSFEFQAYPLGPDVFMNFVTYPLAEGKQVLQRFRDAMAAAKPGLAPIAVCWTFPDAEPFPEAVWGQPFIGIVGPYIGPADEGEAESKALHQLGPVLTNMSGVTSWVEAQKFFDEDYPTGRRYYWKSSYLTDLTDEAIDTLLQLAAERPSQLTSLDIWPMGGAVSEVGVDQSPLGHRHAGYAIGIECNWDDPAADAANYAFGREAVERLRPASTGGSYMNFEDPDDKAATEASYGPALAILQQLKGQVDPTNLFRSRRGLTG